MSASDSRRIPRDQLEAVVKSLYADAEQLDWEHLPPSARTAQYDNWVSAPEIGGVLTKYISSESARSWIKDGPMKEYGRAQFGAGRYARYGSSSGPTPEQLIAHAFGPDAELIEDSVGVKPFHALARVKDTTTYVAWESSKNLRHLVWAVINHLASNPKHGGCVIILETQERPVPQAEKARHARIAERCSIEFRYFRSSVGRRLDIHWEAP